MLESSQSRIYKMLRLHNTLTKHTEEFIPITSGKAFMYNCGPTVYDYAHIGNLRAYVFADILRRALEWSGLEVTQVINVTDIGHLSGDDADDSGEDKMTKALKRENKPFTLTAMRELANFYFEKFQNDLVALNILPAEKYPFASDHITEDIDLISILTEKGYTYPTSDGIYFNTAAYPEYGKLGGGTAGEDSRIGTNPEKKNSRDFALWKFNSELGFDAPFGKGFPGWHIECSAMALKYLGETFDIHTGGIDHIPVHHNNEIAQSECATGKPFAHVWVHSAHVQIEGGKMAKSAQNFLTLNALKESGIHPLSYRTFLLQARYSTQINFTIDSVLAAQGGYEKLLHSLASLQIESTGKQGIMQDNWLEIFTEKINDDLNTPAALAIVFDLLNTTGVSAEDKLETIFEFDKALGLDLKKMMQKISKIPEEISQQIKEREAAKSERNFTTSDQIRENLENKGYKVMDVDKKTLIFRPISALL